MQYYCYYPYTKRLQHNNVGNNTKAEVTTVFDRIVRIRSIHTTPVKYSAVRVVDTLCTYNIYIRPRSRTKYFTCIVIVMSFVKIVFRRSLVFKLRKRDFFPDVQGRLVCAPN